MKHSLSAIQKQCCRLAVIVIISFTGTTLIAQSIAAERPHRIMKQDTWLGFERVHFTVAGTTAWYVKPHQALDGKPWVWRASFPDWHTEMDSLLLTQGFHLFFVQADDLYGGPQAMQIWDNCYQYLTDSLSFAPRVALEAVSRGGLYAYGWAKRNPARVSCIYAEAPVCSILSWPGGKGKGPGDSKSWAQCLGVLKLSEENAKTYRDVPLYDLEGLASYKVPVLHVISNQDLLVPSDENTYALIQNYTALGGPATIYPVTDGPQTLSGHHFPIRQAKTWAAFIHQNSYPVRRIIDQDNYIQTRAGLSRSRRVLRETKKLTVAYVGGSITFNDGWRTKTSSYLQESFPDVTFRFIRTAIPSLGSLPHSFRLHTDLPELSSVDLLFVEAAVNDRGNETDSITQIRALEGIVQQARRANPAMDIILMEFADPNKTSDYNHGIQPVEVANHELVAAHYKLPSINLARLVRDQIQNNEFSWEYDFKDLHPSAFGQEIYFSAIKRLLAREFLYARTPVTQSKTTVKPLDKYSFGHGQYYPIQNAKHDTGWTLDNRWHPIDNLPVREGFTDVPVIWSDTPGAALTLAFEGQAVGIGIVSGADAGVLEFSVDNGPVSSVNLFTRWSHQLHLPWYIMLRGDLKKGKHLLKLRISDTTDENSKGHACRIVHFLVNK
jgi:sialidase-1